MNESTVIGAIGDRRHVLVGIGIEKDVVLVEDPQPLQLKCQAPLRDGKQKQECDHRDRFKFVSF